MFNTAESGVGIVYVADPKELDGEHCISSAVLYEPIGVPGSLFFQRDFIFDISGDLGVASLYAEQISSLCEGYNSSLATIT
jgi:hypothetical protein